MKTSAVLYWAVLLLNECLYCRSQQAPEQTVRLDTGLVRGYIRSADVGYYTSYRGIPYAQQPVGDRRFKRLEPLKPWEGVYDALNEGDVCMQTDVLFGPLMKPSGMSEECIHVNVHVPESAVSTSALPVLVFIHGGAFSMGSSDADIYGPEYLVSKGILVVTFNYRLGVFGFLSLGTKELPGNLGMWDMVELLRWVRRNIASFGGDPDNVTIAGQSAGGVAVHLLTLSNTTEGLFKRAIMMSGSAVRSFATTSPNIAAEQAALLQLKLGINATKPEQFFEALQSAKVGDVLAAATEIQDQYIVTSFQPVVEKVFDGTEPFLSEDPYEIVSSGRARDIPTLIGFTDKEANSFIPRFRSVNFMERLNKIPELILPPTILYSNNSSQFMDKVSKMKTRYFGNKEFSSETFNNFLDAASDSFFIYPALKLANIYAELLSSSVYLYQFSFVGDYHPLQDLIPNAPNGAFHLQDAFYVFKLNSYTSSSITPGTLDALVNEFVTSSFVNFMKFSVPTPSNPKMWPRFTPSSRLSVNINRTLEIQHDVKKDVIQFYDDLYISL